YVLGHLVAHLGAWRSRAWGIFEREGRSIPHFPHQAERLFKILISLAGKAHDEIARERNIGSGRTDAFHEPDVVRCAVPAVHRLEDAVRSRLYRQMEIGHERFKVP